MKIRVTSSPVPYVSTFTIPVPADWCDALEQASPSVARLEALTSTGEKVAVQTDPLAWDADGRLVLVTGSAKIPAETSSLELSLPKYGSAVPSLPSPTDDVLAMLWTGSVRLRVEDVVGRVWEAPIDVRPWLPEDDVDLELQGHATARARDFQTSKLVAGGAGEVTQVELSPWGLIARPQIFDGSGVALLDLEITNGLRHSEGTDETPEAPHLLLRSIELVVPSEMNGVRLGPRALEREVVEVETPAGGTAEEVRLVLYRGKPTTIVDVDGSKHTGPTEPTILRSRDRATFRLALCRLGDEASAGFYRGLRHIGFAEARSWGGCWGPLRDYVPTLTPGLEAEARTLWTSRRSSCEAALGLGLPYIYKVPPSRGHLHALGVSIGYMTGGLEIVQSFGMDVLASASTDGLVAIALEGDMVSDRHSCDLYAKTGRLESVDSLRRSDGSLVCRIFSGEFQGNSGLSTLGFCPRERRDFVPAFDYPKALRPSWWDEWVGERSWEGWERHDTQHLVRGYHHALALALLVGDGVSIERLERESLLTRLEQYEGTGGRLANELARAIEHPQQGTGPGRAYGHAGHAIASSWFFTPLARRAQSEEVISWASDFLTLVDLAQTRSGAFIGNRDSKVGNYGSFRNRWATSQSYEEAIFLRGIFAIARSVVIGGAPILFNVAEHRRFVVGTLRPGAPGHWEQIATGDRSWPPAHDSFTLAEILGDREKTLNGPSQDQQVGALTAYIFPAVWFADSDAYADALNLAATYVGAEEATALSILKAVDARGLFAWDKRAATWGLLEHLVASGIDAKLVAGKEPVA
jgi:hypothetical protein